VSRLVQKTTETLEKIVEAGEKVVKATKSISRQPNISVKTDKKHRQPRQHKKIKEKNSYFNNKRTQKRLSPVFAYERWERPVEAVKTVAETAWRDLCMVSHPPELSKASMAQKDAIIRGIKHTKELAWVLDVYPDILKT